MTLSLSLLTAFPASAQQGAGAERPQPQRLEPSLRQTPLGRAVVNEDSNAHETRQRIQELLQQYPPTIARVLALDPTLLNDAAYLQPYPKLLAFLSQHPEVAHNPSFYFEQQFQEISQRNYDYNDPRVATIRAIDQALGGLAATIIGLTVILTIAWLIRAVIEHRKWLRMSKTHIETHAKLMDRLTSNEDLMAYMQSPAGRKFLEAAPIPVDSGPRLLNAPFGRILWSVQAGVVVAFLGAGLIYASSRLAGSATFSDGELPLFVIGIAAVAVGAGFFISAMVSYGLSHRLGLFPSSGPSSPSDAGTGPTA